MWQKIKNWWFCLQWKRQMKKDKAAGRWPI
jgi:hypothetical protein